MNRRAEDGRTEREHLRGREAAKQKRDPTYVQPELVGPPLPRGGEYLWDWWRRLHRRRSYGESGPLPLTPTAIRDWFSLHRLRIDPWEAEILEDLDDAYLGVVAETRQAAMAAAAAQRAAKAKA